MTIGLLKALGCLENLSQSHSNLCHAGMFIVDQHVDQELGGFPHLHMEGLIHRHFLRHFTGRPASFRSPSRCTAATLRLLPFRIAEGNKVGPQPGHLGLRAAWNKNRMTPLTTGLVVTALLCTSIDIYIYYTWNVL